MKFQLRSTLFVTGVLIGIFAIVKGYQMTRDSARSGKTPVISTKVSDIEPGTYRFQTDIYSEAAESSYSHALLFMRTHDGNLRAWYLPLRNNQPALPADDGLTPTDPCTPFEIFAEQERIECVVDDPANRRKVVHGWSWDGKAKGPLTQALRAVPGNERAGAFVFERPWATNREPFKNAAKP